LNYPKIKVRVPERGESILTTVEINGETWPVTRFAFDTGDINGLVKIRMDFYGEIDFEAETPLAITSVQKARPVLPPADPELMG
jgi:hypothetical protein